LISEFDVYFDANHFFFVWFTIMNWQEKTMNLIDKRTNLWNRRSWRPCVLRFYYKWLLGRFGSHFFFIFL